MGAGDSVPIRERIARQIVSDVESIAPVGSTVHRWDMRPAQLQLNHLDFVVRSFGETVSEELAGHDYVMKSAQYTVAVALRQPDNDIENTEYLAHKYLADIEAAVISNEGLVSDDVRLAIDVNTTDLSGVLYSEAEHLAEASITFTVHYQHDRDNPYVYSGTITELTD
jgi:hypothetical protein